VKKAASIILYVLIGFPLLFSALFAISTRTWAFDRAAYVKVLTDDRLVEILRSPAMQKEVGETVEVGGISLNGPALVAALQKDPPVAELKALAAEAVNDGFDFYEGRTKGRQASLDLAPLKAAVSSRSGTLAADYVAALPAKPGRPAEADFSYRPQGLPERLVSARAAELLKSRVASEVPDSLPWPPATLPAAVENGEGEVLTVGRIDTAIAGVALFAFLFTAGLVLLGERRMHGRLSMAGAFITAPAALILVSSAAAAIAGLGVQRGLLPDAMRQMAGSDGGAMLATYFLGSFLGTSGPVFKSLFTTGLVGVCIGGLLTSVRRWAKQEDDE
jgi:hypothetical protein